MREIAFDTETTGLDPESGHRVVEIGCVEMVNRIRTGKSYHVYLNPERDMPAEAQRVHGLSEEFLADKPRFAEVVDEFLEFIGGDMLVIHNASFDMKFINHELKRAQRAAIAWERAIDTVQMARRKFPGSPANLDALCRRFEIDLTARTKHGALLDAELLSDVYMELLGGKQAVMSLDSRLHATTTTVKKRIPRPARSFEPSAYECEQHAAFLRQLTNPVWKV